MKPDGIISWMLPGERYRNPYRDAIGPLGDFHRIFCVARSPLDAMNSIIPENADRSSFAFRRDILSARFSETLPERQSDPEGILSSVISYTLWFELCMSFLPQLIYRVDRPEDDALLADYVGKPIIRSEEINRNSRPKKRSASFTPEKLAGFPDEWLVRFADIAKGLGYPEDAETIRRFIVSDVASPNDA
ncbi:hypothetical protein [Paracoccus albus]|uniref:hypothetical protein n=1 Tax=Paracoccus albus TaxID=3017784 RepID=UPI0022F139C9|nr:hypothetical protein [Paracoccus albus]WBU60110.1 hypothetical protein PAF20_15440 [Paracoccus albus]